MSSYIPQGKPSLKPKRHHGYAVLLFILGTLFPPLAVAARFGFAGDFWLNLLLTIAGYIPGHVHNFYIQNIRNNKLHRRTPKWAQRYGLVDTSEIQRKQKRSQWAQRYEERLPHSTYEGRAVEDGEVEGALSETTRPAATTAEGLWRDDDVSYYYNANNPNGDSRSTRSSGSGGRWRYPANFEDTEPAVDTGTKKKKKKGKKDRWERTEDAHNLPDEGSKRKRRRKKSGDGASDRRPESSIELPEDPEAAPYRHRTPVQTENGTGDEEIFGHQF